MNHIGHVLVLQRCLVGRVAVSSVVVETGLVLASASPGGPGPDVFGGVSAVDDELDQQVADLRWRVINHAWFAGAGSPFAARSVARDRETASQACASIDKVMWAYQARQLRAW